MKAVKSRTGIVFWLMCLVIAVLVVAFWVQTDLAHRAQDEKTLYAIALEQSDSAVVVIDDHGVIMRWSDGAEKMLGWTSDEIRGDTLERVLPEGMRQAHSAALDKARSTPVLPWTVQVVECDAIAKDGTYIASKVTVRKLQFHGHRFFVGVIDPRSQVEEIEIQ